jgi:hypothetical protein
LFFKKSFTTKRPPSKRGFCPTVLDPLADNEYGYGKERDKDGDDQTLVQIADRQGINSLLGECVQAGKYQAEDVVKDHPSDPVLFPGDHPIGLLLQEGSAGTCHHRIVPVRMDFFNAG